MRWMKPVIGDTRVKTKFLIIPRQMQDADRVNVVTKWLEKASWVELYRHAGINYYGEAIGKWEQLHWVE